MGMLDRARELLRVPLVAGTLWFGCGAAAATLAIGWAGVPGGAFSNGVQIAGTIATLAAVIAAVWGTLHTGDREERWRAREHGEREMRRLAESRTAQYRRHAQAKRMSLGIDHELYVYAGTLWMLLETCRDDDAQPWERMRHYESNLPQQALHLTARFLDSLDAFDDGEAEAIMTAYSAHRALVDRPRAPQRHEVPIVAWPGLLANFEITIDTTIRACQRARAAIRRYVPDAPEDFHAVADEVAAQANQQHEQPPPR